MYSVGDVALRALGAGAAIILYGLVVSCEREPTAARPSASIVTEQPTVLGIARARVIEPGDFRIPNPPTVEAWTSAGVSDPLNTAFDVGANRFLLLEATTSELVEVATGPDGGFEPLTAMRLDARAFGLRDPQGLTVDPRSGRLFILDAGSRIVRVDPHALLGFRRPTISTIDLRAVGLSRSRGIALDPTTGHLHVLEPGAQRLHELSPTGRLIGVRDVSEFRLDDPTGMTFGPTGDATDDESALGLYIAAGGRITELSLTTFAAAATTAEAATLVRTTETWRYSPPSPDPSGLTYAGHLGRLVIVDGEVEEMTIYGGANTFETALSGSLSRSWTTTSFSIEPVGAAYNPLNRHLFISDDDRREVFELDPGSDGLYGTSDDRRTSFKTSGFGSNDPEGLAYDVSQGVLFIIDGVNAEVYRVSPGSNGIFDGVPPAGDDQVTHFDTQVLGLLDPEGIAFDSDFGHLFVVGKPATRVFHITTAGTLIREIDISAAQASKPAGLEYAPRSSGASGKALYMVDRRVDNDSDPKENDGLLYELSLPPFSGNALPNVTISAPANNSAFLAGSAITFTGTASDAEDGNLTAALTWTSSIDGTLGSGGSISTSSLSTGTHTITASVTDAGGGQGTAVITVTVNPAGVVEVRVTAGADDAEDSAQGVMAVSSSDLELVNDGSDQLVGLRFTGLTIAPGATITHASIQFQVDEATSVATSLTIRGEATDNALSFSSTRKISTRNRTTSAVSWSPSAWTAVGLAGAAQRTPSLTSIVQEIIKRPGWSSGNSLAIIITGTGRRVAEAFEGLPAGAPLLRVEYSTGPNTAPTATSVSISGTPQVGRVLTGNYTYSDAQGDPEGASTYRWLRDGAPIIGATTRTYTLVAADQGALIRFEVTPVASTGASPGSAVQSPAVGPVSAEPPNSAPTASNAIISGTPQVGSVLTGNYTYTDADGDAEGTSSYRWLRNGTTISGATARTYTLVAADQGASIVFEVTPVAATGTSPGAAAQSPAVGPVAGTGTSSVVQVRIAARADDAEESATGTVSTGSSDLELVFDGSNQLVGLRFASVAIPPGATIIDASVQFEADRATSGATSLSITGEAADNAVIFSTSGKISTRTRTASAVSWVPAPWTAAGQAGVDQRTPSIASIIQEIVRRPGWSSGNALVVIITGTGQRAARSFDGLPAGAPLLRVEYSQ